MSVLAYPRIYFKGQMYWNPNTMNNTNAYYEEDDASLTKLDGVTTDEQYMQHIMENTAEDGFWNYFGDQGSGFIIDKTRVIGGILPDGSAPASNDPLLQQTINMLGNTFGGRESPPRLVDVNPYTSWTSQLFFDKIEIGSGDTQISLPRHMRMHSYGIHGRNSSPDLKIAGPTGVIWQTAVPFSTLTITNNKGSGLLSAFEQIKEAGTAKGIMVRFATYRTLYFQNGIYNDIHEDPRTFEQLSDLYQGGAVFMNPAYSLVVGTIGLWYEGETVKLPNGRYLSPTQADIPQPPDDKTAQYLFGPTYAEAFPATTLPNGQKLPPRLTLDVLNSFPEFTLSGQKVDLGEIALQVKGDDGNTYPIATLTYEQYNQTAYEGKGGTIDIPLDNDHYNHLQKGQLQLTGQTKLITLPKPDQRKRTKAQFVPQLLEENYLAVTDDRGIYLDEGQTQPLTIQLFYRGNPAPAGSKILLTQYQFFVSTGDFPLVPDLTDKLLPLTVMRQPILEPLKKALGRVDPTLKTESTKPAPAVTFDAEGIQHNIVTVNENGVANVTLSPVQNGCRTLIFYPFGADEPVPTPSEQGDSTYGDFAAVRVMPFDNELEQNTPDSQLTWGFIYQQVFRTYNILYPVMAQFVPMDDRDRMKGAYMQIQALTAPNMFESTLYMPVTRELSAGKQKLIDRWANRVSRGYADS